MNATRVCWDNIPKGGNGIKNIPIGESENIGMGGWGPLLSMLKQQNKNFPFGEMKAKTILLVRVKDSLWGKVKTGFA